MHADAFKEIAADWDHSHKYSPAPRHRRHLILHLLKKLSFNECLDAGCAQPYLLHSICQHFQVKGYGADISTKVVQDNQKKYPAYHFQALDLANERWPENRQFDLVISSEVLEHIPDWVAALSNIAAMAKRYLLITVPSGKLRPIDQRLGHYRHYHGQEIKQAIKDQGFTILKYFKHGFPMHSCYKRAINAVAPDKIYDAFSSGKPYNWPKRIISEALYYAFFLNYAFPIGSQIFILAERNKSPGV